MKVVHLFPNELKFFGGAVEFFLPLEWYNTWVIYCSEERLCDFHDLFPLENYATFNTAYKLPADTDALIVHCLHNPAAKFILEQRPDLPIYIQTWGGDTMTLLDSAWL